MGVSFQAEAQEAVKSDQVIHYTYDDTLIKDATFNVTYYIKDFAKQARLTLEIDTMAVGTDFPRVQAIVSRSMNNVDFHSVIGDTISAVSSIASGHKIATSGLLTVYENYMKITVTAVDSVQNAKVQYYLLIDKND